MPLLTVSVPSPPLPCDRQVVIDHYHLLHGTGVCHGDAEVRHWLWSDDRTELRIIDFDRAYPGGEAERREEMKLVRHLLRMF